MGKPKALGVAAGLLVSAALLLNGGCGYDQGSAGPGSRTPPEPGARGFPDQEITQFILRENTEDGRVAWVLRAERARIYEAQDEVEVDRVTIDFYDDAGEVSSVLTAALGVIARRTNDMRATGNVVVRNREGHELQTEELNYVSETRKIQTDKFVRILRGRDVLTGYGLLTDPDLAGGQFEIQRDVQATVRDLPATEGQGAVDGEGGENGSSTTP